MEELIRIQARDGVELSTAVYSPTGSPSASVIVAHGIASHMGWYGELARILVDQGVSVFVPDRRGSGISGGERGHMDSWQVVTDDLMAVRQEALRREPDRPVHLLGISLGGVFVTAATLRHPDAFAGLVLFAPAFASSIHVPLRRRLRVLHRSFTVPTRLYDLPFGPREITDRPEWQDVLMGDALRTRQVTARFLVQMFRMQRFCQRRVRQLRQPLLCLLASRDGVIDNPRVISILQRARSDKLWIETLNGAPHIIPAALPREDLLARIMPWLSGVPPEGRRIFSTELPQVPTDALPGPPALEGIPL